MINKTITVEEFFHEVIELVKLLEKNGASSLKPKIYSLFMQKMSDMTKYEISEVIEDFIKLIRWLYTLKEEEFDSSGKPLSETAISNKEKVEKIKDINPDSISTVLEEVIMAIYRIKPDYYPLDLDILLHSEITKTVKIFFVKLEELYSTEYPDFLFIPILENENFVKNKKNVLLYFNSLFRKPLNHEIVVISLIVKMLLDYMDYKFREKIIKKILRVSGKDKLDINFFKLSCLVNEVINLYLNSITDNDITFTYDEFRPFLEETANFLKNNRKNLEEIAKEISYQYEEELIEFNEKTLNRKSIYKFFMSFQDKVPEIKSDIKNDDKNFIELVATILNNGFEYYYDFTHFIVESFDSDDIYKFLYLVFKIYDAENTYDEIFEVESYFLYPVMHSGYISKNYNYRYMEKLIRMLSLKDPHKNVSKENIIEGQECLWLLLLYKQEKYEEFLRYSGIFDEMPECLLYEIFANFYVGNISKDELISILKNYGTLFMDNNYIKALIFSLENDKEGLENIMKELKNLNTTYKSDILQLINIYPYESKLYEALEIKFDYTLKSMEI